MIWHPGDPPIGIRHRHFAALGRLHGMVGKPCPYCGSTMDRRGIGPSSPSRDHKIPKCRDGSDTRDNIIICCRACNEDKGALDHEEYLAVLAGLTTRLDRGPYQRWSNLGVDPRFAVPSRGSHRGRAA